MLKAKKKIADKHDEILRVLDETGTWTGKYKNRSYFHEHNLYYATVAVWIIKKNDRTILLEHRHPSKIKNPNRWCLPGGHVSGDETPSLAAMNEAKEEVGLTIPLKKLKFLCLTPPQEDKYSFTHHFYYIYDKIYPGFKIQKEEVTEIKWMKYEAWKNLVKENSKTVSPKWEKYKNAFTVMDEVIEAL